MESLEMGVCDEPRESWSPCSRMEAVNGLAQELEGKSGKGGQEGNEAWAKDDSRRVIIDT